MYGNVNNFNLSIRLHWNLAAILTATKIYNVVKTIILSLINTLTFWNRSLTIVAILSPPTLFIEFKRDTSIKMIYWPSLTI